MHASGADSMQRSYRRSVLVGPNVLLACTRMGISHVNACYELGTLSPVPRHGDVCGVVIAPSAIMSSCHHTCIMADPPPLYCTAFRAGQQPPEIVEFEISPKEALKRFSDYQRKHSFGLHASKLLANNADVPLHAVYLPFWAFHATISVECKGTLGYRSNRLVPLPCNRLRMSPLTGCTISRGLDHSS